ncbi:hypothetical protein [Variovorax guangxiensis]|uniref:hypothetical protein n=1 Tax=Variovorax guangxiensis TaxID=1775474 RepID=UPI00285AD8B5|nr:hypothetical protein [Variovorax guangxiensis]MDR6855635.1 hypothetical protein [Variovorax guangxiensis]
MEMDSPWFVLMEIADSSPQWDAVVPQLPDAVGLGHVGGDHRVGHQFVFEGGLERLLERDSSRRSTCR